MELTQKTTHAHGRTPLWWLAAYAKATRAKQLVDRAGFDIVHIAVVFGQTLPNPAAEYGNKAVSLGPGKDASTDFKDVDVRTSLLLAAKNRHTAVVRLLLGRCRDTDIIPKDVSGGTAYSWDMEEGHTEVRLLLDQAVPNLKLDDAGL
jgi:ankyrin repeat protein